MVEDDLQCKMTFVGSLHAAYSALRHFLFKTRKNRGKKSNRVGVGDNVGNSCHFLVAPKCAKSVKAFLQKLVGTNINVLILNFCWPGTPSASTLPLMKVSWNLMLQD